MGFELPSPTSPTEQARSLMQLKANIEVELEAHISVLKANNITMEAPLVDREGFPRADIDIYAVRGARIRIIELRNDLKGVMDEIGKVLERVYDPAAAAAAKNNQGTETEFEGKIVPFAKVDGVAPGSPASDAGLQREDLILNFGGLTKRSFSAGSLQPLVQHVGANENRAISIEIMRSGNAKSLSLTPRTGWGGRGLLGCHIVPYTSSS